MRRKALDPNRHHDTRCPLVSGCGLRRKCARSVFSADHRNAYVASAALILAQAILLLVFVVAIAAVVDRKGSWIGRVASLAGGTASVLATASAVRKPRLPIGTDAPSVDPVGSPFPTTGGRNASPDQSA
jgi:hypothetical protein